MNSLLSSTARFACLAGLFLGTVQGQEPGSEDAEATPAPAPRAVREALPISSFWESESFQRAFTASYGIDSRIEPKVSSTEKSVLDSVADEMADEDREGAIAKLTAAEGLNESAALIFALGNLRFEEGKIEDAVENFQRALELYPNFRDAHRNLAVALIQVATVLLVGPMIYMAAIIIFQLILLGVVGLLVLFQGGNPMALVWVPAEPLTYWGRMFVALLLHALWVILK